MKQMKIRGEISVKQMAVQLGRIHFSGFYQETILSKTQLIITFYNRVGTNC